MAGVSDRELVLLSVVAPVYDEQETIREFRDRVSTALADIPFELVIVDDGSKDRSAEVLASLADEDPRVRVVFLSRNFGHQTALTAGLDHASGNVVVMLDADLQDPPELISAMLDSWRAGADVVYAVRSQREGEFAGRTKFTPARMLRFSLDAISSFSYRPLQLASLLGFLISALALIAIPVVIGLKIAGSYLPGFSTVQVTLLLLGGIQLISIGIIGEYVGRIYDEVKGRPLYLVRARSNFTDDLPEAEPVVVRVHRERPG
jgi:glycosyltransferase involved in cell wall biosynthesis